MMRSMRSTRRGHALAVRAVVAGIAAAASLIALLAQAGAQGIPEMAERLRLLEILRTAPPAPLPSAAAALSEALSSAATSSALVGHDLTTGVTTTSTAPPTSRVASGGALAVAPRPGRLPALVSDVLPALAPAAVHPSTPPDAAEAAGEDAIVRSQPGSLSAPAATRPRALADTLGFPFNTVYKLLLRFNVSGVDYYYVCSAASVASFQLVTAGHCLYNHDPNQDGGTSDARWADEIWAWAAQTDRIDPIGFPDWPYGVAKAVFVRAYTGWIDNQDVNHDWGIITLDRRVGDRTGWMGREAGVTATALNFSGYASEPPYVPEGTFFQYPGFDPDNVAYYTAFRIGLEAFVYGGHSGGPTWRFTGTDRYIQGVISTSNRIGNAEATRLTSTRFNDLATSIAQDETSRPPVPRPSLIEDVFDANAKDLATGSAAPGQPFEVRYNVLNAGFADSGSITLDFYLAPTPIPTALTYVGSRVYPSGLPAWTVLVAGDTFTVPAGLAGGSYYVGWIMRAANSGYDTEATWAVIGDRTLTVADPLAAFVAGFYVDVLGRQPDQGGLAGWVDFLETHCDAAGFRAIGLAFFDSVEFRTARPLTLEQLVTALYRAFLGRDPELAGRLGWAQHFRDARVALANQAFIPSAEFRSLLPDRTDRAAVTAVVSRFYTDILGRPAEPAGLSGWVNHVVATGDLEGTAIAFVTAAEFEARPLTFRDYVAILYRAFLRRDPEPAGLDGWETVLRQHLIDVIDSGFVPSAEFQSKVPRLCGS